MTVGRICRRDVDVVEPHETVRIAAERMAARNVGTLMVVDGQGRPVGLVTDRDLALRVVANGHDPHSTLVRDVMSSRPFTVSPETPVVDALAAMRAQGVRRLPVLGPGGALAGVISVDDILQRLAGEFSQLGELLEQSSPRVLARA